MILERPSGSLGLSLIDNVLSVGVLAARKVEVTPEAEFDNYTPNDADVLESWRSEVEAVRISLPNA